jgi:hypothetical protein
MTKMVWDAIARHLYLRRTSSYARRLEATQGDAVEAPEPGLRC